MKWFFSAVAFLMALVIGIEANIKLKEEWYYLHKLTTFWIGIALLLVYGSYILVNFVKKKWKEYKEEMQRLNDEIAKVNDTSRDKTLLRETKEELQTNQVDKEHNEDNDHKGEIIEDKVEEEVEIRSIDKLIKSWMHKDKDKMKIAYEELQNEATISSDKIKNEALYYSLLYRVGEDSTRNFETIENKAQGTEVFGNVMSIIANAYQTTHNYEIAISYYEKGLRSHENNTDTNGVLIRGLANSNFMSGNKKEAYRLLKSELNSTNNLEERFEYLNKLAELYKTDNNIDSQISALEKALEIKPNDTSTLFDVAYAYTENNQDNIALLHYKSVVNMDPTHTGALNNLGVAYGRLNLNFSKIKSYKQAFELDNTLAASNLAQVYISAGFEGEARGILEEANSQKNVHEFVGQALVSLQEALKKEKEAEQKKIKEAQDERMFQRKLASAEFELTSDKEPSILIGKWRINEKYESEIEIRDDVVIISWTNFRKYKLEGEINNRYLSLNFYEMDYAYPSIAKEEKGFKNKGTAIGYIEDECSKIQIRIKDQDKLVYYEFLRVKEEKDNK
ncbi:tetratricopeptide repeat protein [Peribacillus butanolivorans]